MVATFALIPKFKEYKTFLPLLPKPMVEHEGVSTDECVQGCFTCNSCWYTLVNGYRIFRHGVTVFNYFWHFQKTRTRRSRSRTVP
jgi:hypothetical protein